MEGLLECALNYSTAVEVEVMGETIIKVTKVSTNDGWPLIYLPKEARDKLGFAIGTKVLIKTDGERLIIEKAE